MSCADCHRNGIEHQTVRGYEGEQHPSGESVATLSCRGCHMGEVSLGGRLGAPRPLHRGLPPLHLEKVSCTSCHSGPRVGAQPVRVQTAMAHGLGLPSHDYTDDTAPVIVAPVLLQDNGVLYPHRMVWPSFWGFAQGEKVTPLSPQAANDALRRVLRVRSNSTFAKTISDNFLEKLAESLAELKKTSTAGGAEPVFVSGGRAYRLKKDSASAPDPAKKEEGKKERGGAKKPGPESVEEFSLEAAKPYAWKLAHDVRPARWSTGAKGCYDCHSAGSPFFEGKVAAVGQAPDKQPITRAMYELAGFEKGKLDAWNQSFQGRAAFKWAGFLAMGVVGLILLTFAMVGLNGLFCAIRRR
jgi:hypothetical protein